MSLKRRRNSGSWDEGFTLLEVMASVAILGLGVVAAIQLFSGGLGLARAARDHTAATLLAREKLSETLLKKELKEGVEKGGADGMEWIVEVSSYGDVSGDASPQRLMKISVRVNGAGQKAVAALTTLRAAAAGAEQ